MAKYPVALERDDNTVQVISPDFPELNTFGMDMDQMDAAMGAIGRNLYVRDSIR